MSDLLAGDLVTPDAGEAPLLNLETVSILKAAPLTRLSLRLREGSQKDAGAAFGADLPTDPLASSVKTKRAALWMGPDEWTLLAPEEDALDLFGAIETKLNGQAHSLVDISDRSDAIILSGEKATWLLNTGIFVDFSSEKFPVGQVTRTLFHKAPVLVWRTGTDTFVIEAWGTFMDYVAGLLVQAAGELEAA